jgi:hypothetical protein
VNKGAEIKSLLDHLPKDFLYRVGSEILLFMIKARAHKGGKRIGKTPKKLASICCP